MHDSYEPIDPIIARNQYAGLRRRSAGFSPEDEQAALATLATANIDKAIRDTFRAYPVPLDPAQVGYLVGLLLMKGSARDDKAADRLERAVREAFYVSPIATAEVRERIAHMIVDGGAK